MRQKIICILLCVIMLSFVIVPSYAEESSNSNVIALRMEWTDMSFSFCGGTWNEDLHIYEGRGWTSLCDEAKITIQNSGDVEVLTSFSYIANEGFEGIDLQFLDNTQAFKSKTIGINETVVVSVVPLGEPTESFSQSDIGAIVVMIARSTEE